MTARMRRLTADWQQIQKDFTGHQHIVVKPEGGDPPEKYHVTYYVNGIYLLPDGRVQTQSCHEVEITLQADYPRYKPVCRILTPIFHPNFRDTQICIGDIWGAGEMLSDIIINIGDMIQYKSWNSYSPLSAEAAQWAMTNKHLFPVGTVDLRKPDYTASGEEVEIDLFEQEDEPEKEPRHEPDKEPEKEIEEEPEKNAAIGQSQPAINEQEPQTAAVIEQVPLKAALGNDFDISEEELEGIEFIPTASRMQSASHGALVQKKKVDFKTIFKKGLLWGLAGGVLAFVLQELISTPITVETILPLLGYANADALINKIVAGTLTSEQALTIIRTAVQISSAIFSALVALGLGLFMGIGEGVYYGSKKQALRYAGIGAAVSIIVGFVSGFLAQVLYAGMLSGADKQTSDFVLALIRGVGWAIMGFGIGLAIGAFRPDKKRLLFCGLGGLGGGFVGGFLFNFIVAWLKSGESDTGLSGRAAGIIIMCLLIGLGIGLLEQFAKQAWLKVIRGEFEGKEYLVFSGTTSIGNNGTNTIVLFKDKLVGPNHCDIVLEGSKYYLLDKGTPMGTVVNGNRISGRTMLKQGDTIAIGNSVLVFNTK